MQDPAQNFPGSPMASIVVVLTAHTRHRHQYMQQRALPCLTSWAWAGENLGRRRANIGTVETGPDATAHHHCIASNIGVGASRACKRTLSQP